MLTPGAQKTLMQIQLQFIVVETILKENNGIEPDSTKLHEATKLLQRLTFAYYMQTDTGE